VTYVSVAFDWYFIGGPLAPYAALLTANTSFARLHGFPFELFGVGALLCRPPACGAHVSFGALQDARNRSITAEVMLRCWAACRCRQARVRAQPHHCAATLAHREYLPPVDAIAKGRGPVGDGRCAPPD
jgi:hypothetical protein